MRAVDSISSNLAEGPGRYHYGESKNFAYYSGGSLFETKSMVDKGAFRVLIKEDESESIFSKLDVAGEMINTYINSIGGPKDPETRNAQ